LDKQREREFSKLLSFVLRHNPAFAGLKPDRAGWVSVHELLSGLSAQGKTLSQEELSLIVSNNNKKRFALSEDGQRIRTSQGHSIEVELGYQQTEPPELLYHGTASRFIKAIADEGLTKRARHHVHLSASIETASNVGQRHGTLVLLTVRAGEMHRNGYVFLLSDNGVWLTDNVPTKFIEFPEVSTVE
jgi:putative RNA 2'-phosphotransferase